MADDRIHIARGSLELGVLSRAEAGELLSAGFLLPTDSFRADDSEEFRPLGQLCDGPRSTARSVARIKEATTRVGSSVARVAAKLVSATGRGSTAIGTAASCLLEGYLPRIRESVGAALAKSTGAIDSRVHDEGFLRKLFGAAYDTLPKPVRRFVGEEAFVEFCLKHRNKLLGKNH